MAMSASSQTEEQLEGAGSGSKQFDLKNFRCPSPDHVDVNRIAVTYDRFSDSLFMHLYGKGVPSISVPVDRFAYLLFSPEGKDFLGFQIEGFLAQAVKENPDLIEILNFAELRGITPAEVQVLRNKTLGPWTRFRTRLRRMFIRSLGERRKQVVEAFLHKEGEGIRMQTASC